MYGETRASTASTTSRAITCAPRSWTLCAALVGTLCFAPTLASAQRPRAHDVLPRVRAALDDPRAQLVGRALDVGGGRWIVLATRERPDFQFDLVAFSFVRRDGGLAETGWVVLPTTELWAATNGQPLPQPRVLASAIDDWDDDGERELELVVAYNTDEPCTAATAYRQYYALEVASLRIVASIKMREEVLNEDTVFLSGTVRHEDTDGDGHRDLVLRYRRCEPVEDVTAVAVPMRCSDVQREVHRWSASEDAWTEVPASIPSAPCPEASR